MPGTPMTQAGHDRLQKELDHLKSVERPKVVQAIAEARAHGDLKENAEYHAAKDKQGLMEAKVKHLEAQLGQAQIIDVTQFENQGKVIFGATVTILDQDDDTSQTLQIVGADEADLSRQQISIQAPLARALIGKHQGDDLQWVMPNGAERFLEITKVDYI